MTPQLMQAIKLLQLSNLDLTAYVEGELERNPLLERAGEREDESAAAGQEPAASHNDGATERRLARRRSDPRGHRRSARHRHRERLSRRARRRAAGAERAGGLFGMVGRRLRRTRGRRLQPRSFRFGRGDAGRPSRRAACARRGRSGAPHDRPPPHRSRRRSGLSGRRPCGGRRQARRIGGRGRSRARRPAVFRSARRLRAQPGRMSGHPAQGARSFRSRHAGAGRAPRTGGAARVCGAPAYLRRRRRRISPT